LFARTVPPATVENVEPTVLTDGTTDMVITKVETFGPVTPFYRFKTDDEAIKMANDTEFGLAAYFYSCDIGRIWRFTWARNTASRNSSKSNISAWAASAAEDCAVTHFRSDPNGRGYSLRETSGRIAFGTAPGADARRSTPRRRLWF
jgi:hypothetical protein